MLDANILFRTLISQGEILRLIFDESLKLFAPLKLKQEFLNNKEEILSKSRLSEDEFNILSSLIFKRIEFVPLSKYKKSLPEAKELLGKHIKDEDFVTLCLSKDILLWTYEPLLSKIGIGISTKQISEQLSKESQEFSTNQKG